MERRNKNYATVVYPESAPENWQSILSDLHIPSVISPLHDLDVNEDGEIKKEHYHVLCMWEGLKSRAQAKEVFDLIGGVGCESVQAVRAYARYLCHMDDSTKVQYEINDVIELSGAYYRELIRESVDKYTVIGDILDFAMDNGIISFAELVSYSRKNRPQWYMALCDWPWPVIHFLRSKQWEIERHQKSTRRSVK